MPQQNQIMIVKVEMSEKGKTLMDIFASVPGLELLESLANSNDLHSMDFLSLTLAQSRCRSDVCRQNKAERCVHTRCSKLFQSKCWGVTSRE